MRNPNRRSTAIGKVLAILVIALGAVTPASAQFGGLKKALKGKAAEKAVEKAAPDAAEASAAPTETAAEPAKGAEDNSTVVLTSDVVDHFLAGLRAAKAEREVAAKEDSPYGRYIRSKLA